jgi:hypothetical protein
LDAAAQKHLQAYLAGLNLAANTPVEQVSGWKEAEAVLRDPAWDASWWEREEKERQRLYALAAAKSSELLLLQALTAATDRMADSVHAAATAAAARAGVTDAYMIRIAAGAAMQAEHQVALALLAGEAGHFFASKYSLFAGGHWPLGLYAGTLRFF